MAEKTLWCIRASEKLNHWKVAVSRETEHVHKVSTHLVLSSANPDIGDMLSTIHPGHLPESLLLQNSIPKPGLSESPRLSTRLCSALVVAIVPICPVELVVLRGGTCGSTGVHISQKLSGPSDREGLADIGRRLCTCAHLPVAFQPQMCLHEVNRGRREHRGRRARRLSDWNRQAEVCVRSVQQRRVGEPCCPQHRRRLGSTSSNANPGLGPGTSLVTTIQISMPRGLSRAPADATDAAEARMPARISQSDHDELVCASL